MQDACSLIQNSQNTAGTPTGLTGVQGCCNGWKKVLGQQLHRRYGCVHQDLHTVGKGPRATAVGIASLTLASTGFVWMLQA